MATKWRIGFRQERIAAALIVLAFLCVNFAVATRTPTVGVDEPQHSDPAANLYFGRGFTSTMWGQGRTDFCCCNDPLFQGILFCFFKIFGFSLFNARALNTILAALGAILIWSALRRTNLVEMPANRLLCLALVLSGSVSTLTFRTVRYDATMFLVSSLVFFAASFRSDWPGRYLLVFLFSALLPAAGLPMLPYWGSLLAINFLVYRSANTPLLAAIAAGLAAGIGGLVLFYSSASALRPFLEIALPSTALSRHERLLARITGTPIDPDNILTCFFGNPVKFLDPKVLFDYSAALLFIVFCAMALRLWHSTNVQTRRFVVHTMIVTLLIPPVMHFAGHYRSYYRWMTYMPLCIAVPRMLESPHAIVLSALLRRIVELGICVSLFMGVPLRTLAALPGWRERSPEPIERAVAEVARPSDIAVCDFKVYFAVRPHVSLLYAYGITATGEFSRTKDLPTNNVSLLCVSRKGYAAVTNMIDGKWKQILVEGAAGADALNKTRYAVDFYRRDPEAGSTR